MSNIRELAESFRNYSIDIRREFHMYPELSFKENRTSRRIMEELDKMGIENRRVTDTGVVAEIGKTGGKVVALRADIDALEVEEQTGLEYASGTKGIMHACGHDAHAAALLTAAKIFKEIENELEGRVKLIFQPAEERVQGAPKMMAADNFMDDVDVILGIHNMPEYDAGDICVRDGGMMFAGEYFEIKVEGLTGHGAMPEESVDALLIGSKIVVNLQEILSREIDSLEPAVLTIGHFNSGSRFNVMAGTAELKGTYRCYSKEIENKIKEGMVRIAENTARAFRGKAEVNFDMYVPAVINSPEVGIYVRESAKKVIGNGNIREVKSLKGSDDFSYYLEKAPGYYVFIGSGVKDKSKRKPIHSGDYILDEEFINVAAALYAQFAKDYLSE